jgi:predicted PurR-regulated permease PerM
MSEPVLVPTPVPVRDTELPNVPVDVARPSTIRGRRIALSILLLLSFLAVARLAAPLWVGIAFGTMMAFTAQPTYRFLNRRLHERRSTAAALTTVLTGLVVAVCGTLVVWILTREVLTLVAMTQRRLASGSLADMIGERGVRLLARLGVDREQIAPRVSGELSRAAGWAASVATTVLQTATSAALGLLVALMTMYYVLLEWPTLPVRLERVLPLDPRHTRALMLEFRDVGRSALVGTIATALVQGLLAGIGFAIAGLPQVLTLGLLTALGSFVPIVGTAVVYVPIAIYLILIGSTCAGVFTLLWGVIVVMAIADYVIRPRIVGGKGQGHPFLLLLAILGGIEVFGLPGLFVGPVLMTMFVAVLRIYEREADTGAL